MLQRLPYEKVKLFYLDCLKRGLKNAIEIWSIEPLMSIEGEDMDKIPIQVREGKARVIQGWPINVIQGRPIKVIQGIPIKDVKKNDKEDSNENQNNEEKRE
jgi:hypothetical protein